ncbi:MAG TPA: DNA-binding domain-containing protein, partial [Edaphobacter sp.]|nr:DNA-binding domain-containing protein [Edaphobacter sp.]
MNLLDLQRRMAEDVMRPLTSDFQMQPTTSDGSSTHELVAGYIKPNDRLNSFERLEIYNRQYWFRVIGAVAEDYPALNAVLGDKIFDRLVLAYLRENPSTSFTLR